MSKFDFLTPDGYKSAREIRHELLNGSSLNGLTFTEDQVNKIMEMFWFRDTHASFIAQNSVYPKFIEFLRKYGSSFRRNDFYDYVYSNHPLYKAIERLSLDIEIRCRGDYTNDEFKEIENKLSISKNDLINAGILTSIDNGVVISHHTISEYFVSRNLLASDTTVQKLFSYSVVTVESTNEIFFNSSWYGVALFLLNSNKVNDIVDLFLELADKNKKVVDENFTEILSHSDFQKLSVDRRARLFDHIYKAAMNSGIWISEWSVDGLVSLSTEESILELEKDLIDEPKGFQDIVKTTNIISVMGELIKQNKIPDSDIVQRWREIFVKYATQKHGTGVLQRRSLESLESFKDETILERVKSAFEFEVSGIADQFVQEAFLRLCYEISPNSKSTIDYLVRGFFTPAKAYSWFGLNYISNVDSIIYFFQKLNEDSKLLDVFLDGEEVFLGSDDDEEEKRFIKSVRIAFSGQVTTDLISVTAELIQKACDNERYFPNHRKSFIPKLFEIALYAKKDFWVDVFSYPSGEKRNRDYISFTGLLGLISKEENYKDIFNFLKTVDKKLQENYVYNLPNLDWENNLLKELGKPLRKIVKWDDRKKEEKKSVLEKFREKLEPAPKQFMTDVFDYYLKHDDEIGELNKKDKDRLIYLAYEDGVYRVDPNEFTVKINNYGDSKNYTWTSHAQFYGDMIRVIQKLNPTLLKHCKQHLIDFIPFAYSDDLSTIFETVKEVSDTELTHITNAYLDRNNDRRYLITSSYIYFVKHYKKLGQEIISPKEVLKSFIDDEKISIHDQQSALEALELFIGTSDRDYYDYLKNIEKKSNKLLSQTANEILIKKYKDPNSIQQRISEIKEFAVPVKPHISGEAYRIEFPESEFTNKTFAWPLIEVADPSQTEQFLELLYFAEGFSKNPDSQAFVEYINHIIYGYFEKIASIDNYKELVKLEKWLDRNYSIWWKYNFPKLQSLFIRAELKKTRLKTVNAKAFIVNPLTSSEIENDKSFKTFWEIVSEVGSNTSGELSPSDMDFAKEFGLIDENGIFSEDCKKLASSYGDDDFCCHLSNVLFMNDRFVNWSTFRYLHPDYFIIETNGNDQLFSFCLFLHSLGIINNPKTDALQNSDNSRIFIQYTQTGKKIMLQMQKEFLNKNSKTVFQITDSFNAAGVGISQNIHIEGNT